MISDRFIQWPYFCRESTVKHVKHDAFYVYLCDLFSNITLGYLDDVCKIDRYQCQQTWKWADLVHNSGDVQYINDLMQDCGISNALAMEKLQSCTKQSLHKCIEGSIWHTCMHSFEMDYHHMFNLTGYRLK